MITSVKPLRVYVYEGEALLRFCPKDYEPFDPADVDKYVVGDDYTPTWEIPSLKRYYSALSYTHKESLNAYVRSLGHDPDVIWSQIRSVIRTVLISKLPEFLELAEKYSNNARNFFELSRFDFVLDEKLKVFLMEANMSPNLSSAHFKPNRLLYEQVLFNLFSVAGVARHIHAQSLAQRSSDEREMVISDKDLQVYADLCGNEQCNSCSNFKCKICNQCLTVDQRQVLHDAYHEHVNRHNTRRIIPVPLTSEFVNSESTFENHLKSLDTEDDRLVAWWFRGKCLQDKTWCS